ncbi:MAG: F0F1 ATP synthase subunit B [Magnetococcus sp. WYHC-3]
MATSAVAAAVHVAEVAADPVAAAAVGHAAGGGSGLPQFDAHYFSSQAFWTLVSFAVLLYLIQRYVVPPISRMLDERAKSIADDLKQAKDAREQAEHALAEYRHQVNNAWVMAARTIEEARQDAARQRARALKELDEELTRKKAAALADIEQAHKKSLAELREVAVELTMAATRKMIGHSLGAADAERMVSEAVEDLNRHRDRVH